MTLPGASPQISRVSPLICWLPLIDLTSKGMECPVFVHTHLLVISHSFSSIPTLKAPEILSPDSPIYIV